MAEKPAGAWTPEETVDVLLDKMAAGDFYILCPDNETTREMDEKRMRWSSDDVIRNRPALSRWHPDHKAAFAAHMEAPLEGGAKGADEGTRRPRPPRPRSESSSLGEASTKPPSSSRSRPHPEE